MRKYLAEKIIKEYLNESSFSDYSIDNILTDKYITDFIKDEDAAENILDFFITKNELDEDDRDEIRLSPEFKEEVRENLERDLESALNNIYDKIDYHSNKIIIYRAITVNDAWLKSLKTQKRGLGIYWSWDESGAIVYWGEDNNNTAIIKGEIDEKSVDWETTLKMNMHPNYSEEKEIRLFENTPIKVKSIEVDGEKIVSSFFNKTKFLS